jgi:hypothetical protein
MQYLARVVQAHNEGQLLTGMLGRLGWKIDPEAELRFRLGLRKMSGFVLPLIVMSGDFSSDEGRALKVSLQAAIDGCSKLPAAIRGIKGMSGQRYRTLINTLVETLDHPRYLEIGSWHGSTAAAAISGNAVQALCIDNWSQFSGSRDQFMANVEQAKSSSSSLRLIEDDFRKLDYRVLGKFNVFLFDGPHSEMAHRDGILLVQPCLTERFVLIVDDWNWPSVRIGTMSALLAAKCRVEASVQLRTTLDNSHPLVAYEASDWHNGYFIAVVRRGRAH